MWPRAPRAVWPLLLLLLLLVTFCGNSAANASSIPGLGDVANFSQSQSLASLGGFLKVQLHQWSLRVADAQAKGTALGDAALRGIWENIFNAVMNFIKRFLDPIHLGDLHFPLNSSSVTGYVSLKSVDAAHLGDLTVEKYSFSLLSMCVTVDALLPHLALSAVYDTDVSILLEEDSDSTFPIFGAGPAKVDMYNIRMHTDICATITKPSVTVSNMKVSVERDKIDIQGLFGGGAVSDLISGVATDVVPDMVQEFQQETTQYLMKTINDYIKSKLLAGDTTTPSTTKT